jgi:choline dehydrogenase-like flavoprotein
MSTACCWSDTRPPEERLLEEHRGEYGLDYRSAPQEHGNSGIRQARLRILGGCSTANTMISWRPRVADLREWVDLGAVFPTISSVNPVVTVMLTAERAADLIRQDL